MEYENKEEIERNSNENIVVYDNESENTEIETQDNGIAQENAVIENTTVEDTMTNLQNEKLEQIHQDLGVICSFLIIFALVIVFRYVYKFFDIFFKI